MMHNKTMEYIEALMDEEKYHLSLLSEFLSEPSDYKLSNYPHSDQYLFVFNLLQIYYEYRALPFNNNDSSFIINTFDFKFKNFYDFIFEHKEWPQQLKNIKDKLLYNFQLYNQCRPVIAAVLLSPDQTHMLWLESSITNKTKLPKGFIQLGESPETACIREVKQSTGLDISESIDPLKAISIPCSYQIGHDVVERFTTLYFIYDVPLEFKFNGSSSMESYRHYWTPVESIYEKSSFSELYLDIHFYINYFSYNPKPDVNPIFEHDAASAMKKIKDDSKAVKKVKKI